MKRRDPGNPCSRLPWFGPWRATRPGRPWLLRCRQALAAALGWLLGPSAHEGRPLPPLPPPPESLEGAPRWAALRVCAAEAAEAGDPIAAAACFAEAEALALGGPPPAPRPALIGEAVHLQLPLAGVRS